MSRGSWMFLPHPQNGVDSTRVFVQAPESEEIPSIEGALKYLFDHAAFPVLLTRVSLKGTTVVLQASRNPDIFFSCTGAMGDSAKDIREIIDVLQANGLPSKFIG